MTLNEMRLEMALGLTKCARCKTEKLFMLDKIIRHKDIHLRLCPVCRQAPAEEINILLEERQTIFERIDTNDTNDTK